MFTPSFLHITNLYIFTSLHTHQKKKYACLIHLHFFSFRHLHIFPSQFHILLYSSSLSGHPSSSCWWWIPYNHFVSITTLGADRTWNWQVTKPSEEPPPTVVSLHFGPRRWIEWRVTPIKTKWDIVLRYITNMIVVFGDLRWFHPPSYGHDIGGNMMLNC